MKLALERRPLNIGRRCLVVVIAAACVVFGLSLALAALHQAAPTDPDLQFQTHTLRWITGDVDEATFGAEELKKFYGQKYARRALWLDLLTPLAYGFAFLLGFRTLLMALPRHMLRPARRTLWLLWIPLVVAMFADWAENLVALYQTSHAGGAGKVAEGAVSTAIIVGATVVKTAAFAVLFASLIGFSLLVLARGESELAMAPQPAKLNRPESNPDVE